MPPRPPLPVPYWRLSAFYLCYFASLGALIPYLGPYLRSLGYGPAAIGALMGVLMATKIVAPNLWAWIADRRGQRMPVVRAATLLAFAGFAAVPLAGGALWTLALVMAAFSFFWNAALPQLEAVTLNHLGDRVRRYTRIRLWGSVGFIITVAALGPLLEAHGPGLLPGAVLPLMAGIWLASLAVPEQAGAAAAQPHEPLRRVLRRPAVLALLLVCLLMQASHGPYYAFFSIYLEDHGYGGRLIGGLWALGVAAEVVLFAGMPRLLGRFGLRPLFLACFGLTGLRWVLVGLLVDSLPWLLLAQVLHAASFGIYHAVAIQLVHRFFTGRHQGRGQALYSSMSFGAGGALGSLLSGIAWQGAGPLATWLGAALASALALGVAWRWIPALEPGAAAAR